MPRTEDAEHRSEEQCDQAGAERQNDRRDQTVEDLLRHGLVRIDGLSHVAVEQIADIAEKLNVERLIQPVLLRQRLDHLRRRRLRAGEQADRIARRRVDNSEVDAKGQGNTQKACQGAFSNVSCHGFLLCFCCAAVPASRAVV